MCVLVFSIENWCAGQPVCVRVLCCKNAQALQAAGINTMEGPLPPVKEIAAAAPKPAVVEKKAVGGKEFTMEEVCVYVSVCVCEPAWW
jgi:hypothetical protein